MYASTIIAVTLAGLLCVPGPSGATTPGSPAGTPAAQTSGSTGRPAAYQPPPPKSVMQRHKAGFIGGAFVVAPVVITLSGMQMWEWGSSTHFKAHSDGWFSPSTSHGGADKLGHLFTFYLGSRLFTTYFSGVYPEDPWKAALLGAFLSAAAGVAVEIGDGYATDYGFSYTDIVFDLIGVGFALAQARWPWFDELFGLSLTHYPSDGFLSKYNANKTDVVTDYSGQLVTLNVKLGGIPVVRDTPLRFLRLDLGYFTRCYQTYDACSAERSGTHAFESRNVYVGLSLDIRRLLREFTPYGRPLRAAGEVFSYLNIFPLLPVGATVNLDDGGAISLGQGVSFP